MRDSRHPLRRHLLAVAGLARSLARRYGADPVRASLAGYLHDWLKPAAAGRMRVLARRYGVRLDEDERKMPAIVHGPVAAGWARRELGIGDAELLGAIRWHTTGRKESSLLERVLFVADFCAAGRRFPEASTGLRLSGSSLDLARRYVLASKLAHLSATGVRPHPAATALWRSFSPGEGADA